MKIKIIIDEISINNNKRWMWKMISRPTKSANFRLEASHTYIHRKNAIRGARRAAKRLLLGLLNS